MHSFTSQGLISLAQSVYGFLAGVGPLFVHTSDLRPDLDCRDQFCSLIFTLSNLYFVGCAYEQRWDNVWQTCSTSRNWGAPFALAALPLLVRTVQSIKRYVDSRLITHLINVSCAAHVCTRRWISRANVAFFRAGNIA